jgi:hypothetical protein
MTRPRISTHRAFLLAAIVLIVAGLVLLSAIWGGPTT